jgi:hypothetical protein
VDHEATKRNCWELAHCGKEPGGTRIGEMGVCPAAVEGALDGLNAGENAGRICWVVSGTYCNGEIQGTAARKELTCRFCEVYRQIKEEEGADFFPKVPGRPTSTTR